MSVAVQVDGASVAGAVADVAAGALYSAALGHGRARAAATAHVDPLRCSPVVELSMSLVGTGFALRARSSGHGRPQSWPDCCRDVRDVRRIGSAALDLCMVAAGRLDAYYEDGLNVWDWAAGALIAAEAGASLRLPPADGGERGTDRGGRAGRRRRADRRIAQLGAL